MKNSLKIVLVAQLLMLVIIGLDIPILRQIFVFIYISFVPGFLILRILNINVIDGIDALLLSLGLSISFIMFVGLFINELYPFLGILKPLSTIPLTITISGSILIFLFVNYKQKLLHKNSNPFIELKKISFQLLLLLFLPVLSVIGTLYVNKYIIILMILIIITVYLLTFFSSRLFPIEIYPIMIICISLSLLLSTSLISQYLFGFDVHRENYVYEVTKFNSRWYTNIPSATTATSKYNSMLSVTILPTIYSVLLNIKGELIFKIIYPFIFSFVPLALFQIYKKQTEKSVALLSVFFFISNATSFFGAAPISLCKQQIGELFFLLSILILLNKDIIPRKNQALFMIFSLSIIVSHYALSHIYIFYIVFTFIFVHKNSANKTLNKTSILFIICMTFIWDIYVSASIFKHLNLSFTHIINRFYLDFFILESRASIIQRIVVPEPSIVNLIHILLFYLTHFFIFIGTIKLIVKRKETNFDPEYRLMLMLSVFIILVCLIIPNLAHILHFERIRSITLLFLAPLFSLGGKDFISLMRKTGAFIYNKIQNESYTRVKWDLRLVSVVMITFFLFQVGFVNHIMDDKPISFSLDINRMKTTNNTEVQTYFHNAYTPEQDVFSALWLSKNVKNTARIYSDKVSKVRVLTSYGMISGERIYLLSNNITLRDDAYIYLRHLNVVKGLVKMRGESINISEISSRLNENNLIYSNGHSEIYMCAKLNDLRSID